MSVQFSFALFIEYSVLVWTGGMVALPCQQLHCRNFWCWLTSNHISVSLRSALAVSQVVQLPSMKLQRTGTKWPFEQPHQHLESHILFKQKCIFLLGQKLLKTGACNNQSFFNVTLSACLGCEHQPNSLGEVDIFVWPCRMNLQWRTMKSTRQSTAPEGFSQVKQGRAVWNTWAAHVATINNNSYTDIL